MREQMANAAARSVFRSPAAKIAASRLGAGAKATRSPFCAHTSRKPLCHRLFRCPAEMSACVGSLQPFHTATASALMTSMLSLSCSGYGWLPEACNDDAQSMCKKFENVFVHEF